MANLQKEGEMEFGTTLLRILEGRGLRPADLSRMTGLSTGLVSNYLNNKSKPTLGNAILIADALAISLDELAGRNVPSTAAQRELLSYFGQLNEEGQEAAIRQVQGMTSIDVYKKSYSVRVGKAQTA